MRRFGVRLTPFYCAACAVLCTHSSTSPNTANWKAKRKEEPAEKIGNRIEDAVTLDDLRDHLMANYLKNLGRLVES